MIIDNTRFYLLMSLMRVLNYVSFKTIFDQITTGKKFYILHIFFKKKALKATTNEIEFNQTICVIILVYKYIKSRQTSGNRVCILQVTTVWYI